MRRRVGSVALLCFLGLIPLANWMILHVGTVCPPGGPCLVPVAPGLMAPSGVVTVGVALVLRDVVQRCLGTVWGIAAILAGTALSVLVAPPALVAGSGVAFLLSELADFAIYTPLQRRRLMLAVLASAAAGVVIELGRVPKSRLRQPRLPGGANRGQVVGRGGQRPLHPVAAPDRTLSRVSGGCRR